MTAKCIQRWQNAADQASSESHSHSQTSDTFHVANQKQVCYRCANNHYSCNSHSPAVISQTTKFCIKIGYASKSNIWVLGSIHKIVLSGHGTTSLCQI